MDRDESRRKIEGLERLVQNRGEDELEAVFDEVAAYIEKERPEKKRAEKSSRDRMDRGGINREAK